MKRLEIVQGADNPILRAMSKPVERFDSGLKKFVKQMREAMVRAKGIGIAAPQVGENIRVFLAVLDQGKATEVTIPMVNPEITEWSEEKDIDEEGCLSLPGAYGKVARALRVKIVFFDLEGGRQMMELSGLNARVVQHELDHLDGVLFIDKLAE